MGKLNVYFPAELDRAMREWCDERDWSLAQLVKTAVADYIGQESPDDQRAERQRFQERVPANLRAWRERIG